MDKKNDQTKANNVVARLKKMGRQMTVETWARDGIPMETSLGVALPELKSFAKKLGSDHGLAQALWDSKIYDARILASLIERPEQVSEEQMNAWVEDFNCAPLCDHVCFNLFNRSRHAWTRIAAYSRSELAFTRRAAFSLIWTLATHNKNATDESLLSFLELIPAAATDERDYVYKAVDLALRALGKRNLALNEAARAVAMDLFKSDSSIAVKTGDRALRELESESVLRKLQA